MFCGVAICIKFVPSFVFYFRFFLFFVVFYVVVVFLLYLLFYCSANTLPFIFDNRLVSVPLRLTVCLFPF